MEKSNRKRLYPKFWQHDYHVLTQLRVGIMDFVRKYLVNKGSLVDYGCGSMPYKDLINPYVKEYVGVDIGKNPLAQVHIKPGQKLPLKTESVTAVLSTQVLEHVDTVDLYLEESFRILKREGFLFLSTHGVWPYHEHPQDYRRWTRSGLIYEIERAGFTVLEVKSVLNPYTATLQFQVLLVAETLMVKGIVGRICLHFLSILGNFLISVFQKFSNKNASDAAIFIIAAQKK